MIQPLKYRGYTITHDPPPIPYPSFAWQFVHEGYDGAPDGGDIRCGSGASEDDCKAQIDELITYLEEMATERSAHESTHMPWML